MQRILLVTAHRPHVSFKSAKRDGIAALHRGPMAAPARTILEESNDDAWLELERATKHAMEQFLAA